MTTNIKYSQLECLILYMWIVCTEWHDPKPTFDSTPSQERIKVNSSITQFSKPEAASWDSNQARQAGYNVVCKHPEGGTGPGSVQCQQNICTLGPGLGTTQAGWSQTQQWRPWTCLLHLQSLICNIALLSHNSYQFYTIGCCCYKWQVKLVNSFLIWWL